MFQFNVIVTALQINKIKQTMQNSQLHTDHKVIIIHYTSQVLLNNCGDCGKEPGNCLLSQTYVNMCLPLGIKQQQKRGTVH